MERLILSVESLLHLCITGTKCLVTKLNDETDTLPVSPNLKAGLLY